MKAAETESLKSFPSEQQLNQVMSKNPETEKQIQETNSVQNPNTAINKYIPAEPQVNQNNTTELPPLIIEDKAFQGENTGSSRQSSPF